MCVLAVFDCDLSCMISATACVGRFVIMHATDLGNSTGFLYLLGARCQLLILKAVCITDNDADHVLLKYNTLKSIKTRKHVDMSKAKRF